MFKKKAFERFESNNWTLNTNWKGTEKENKKKKKSLIVWWHRPNHIDLLIYILPVFLFCWVKASLYLVGSFVSWLSTVVIIFNCVPGSSGSPCLRVKPFQRNLLFAMRALPKKRDNESWFLCLWSSFRSHLRDEKFLKLPSHKLSLDGT